MPTKLVRSNEKNGKHDGEQGRRRSHLFRSENEKLGTSLLLVRFRFTHKNGSPQAYRVPIEK